MKQSFATRLKQLWVPKAFRLPEPEFTKEQVDLLEELIQLIHPTLSKAEMAGRDDKVHMAHFLVDLGTGIWRIRRKIEGLGRMPKEIRDALFSLESTWKSMSEGGVEIIDHIGTIPSKNEAKIVEVRDIPNLAREQVVDAVKPTILLKGEVIQLGEVVMGRPAKQAEPTPQPAEMDEDERPPAQAVETLSMEPPALLSVEPKETEEIPERPTDEPQTAETEEAPEEIREAVEPEETEEILESPTEEPEAEEAPEEIQEVVEPEETEEIPESPTDEPEAPEAEEAPEEIQKAVEPEEIQEVVEPEEAEEIPESPTEEPEAVEAEEEPSPEPEEIAETPESRIEEPEIAEPEEIPEAVEPEEEAAPEPEETEETPEVAEPEETPEAPPEDEGFVRDVPTPLEAAIAAREEAEKPKRGRPKSAGTAKKAKAKPAADDEEPKPKRRTRKKTSDVTEVDNVG